MPLTDAALWSEINSPTYNTLDDVRTASTLNSLTGTGAAAISLPVMDTDSFVRAFMPYLDNIANLANAAKKDKFWRLWGAITGMASVHVTDPNVQAAFGDAVAQGVLTQAQAGALSQRTGSRAEVLWGPGTVVGWADVARVRNTLGGRH